MLKISLDVDDMSKNNNPFDASNQTLRYEKASKIILESIMRNKPITEGGANCPILVEGIKDEAAYKSNKRSQRERYQRFREIIRRETQA